MSNLIRDIAIDFVSFVADNAGSFRELHADQHAVVRDNSVLVGWQCGFEPLFVAVNSYIEGDTVSEEEAVELAMDGLAERNWFSGEPTKPDHVLSPEAGK